MLKFQCKVEMKESETDFYRGTERRCGFNGDILMNRWICVSNRNKGESQIIREFNVGIIFSMKFIVSNGVF